MAVMKYFNLKRMHYAKNVKEKKKDNYNSIIQKIK